MTKKERTDLSKAIGDLVTRGRILLAIEKCRDGEVSLGKAAELGGMPTGQMMKTLTDFAVKSRIEQVDYLQGLENPKKAW
jgi:predicted HTH domain antitoxin